MPPRRAILESNEGRLRRRAPACATTRALANGPEVKSRVAKRRYAADLLHPLDVMTNETVPRFFQTSGVQPFRSVTSTSSPVRSGGPGALTAKVGAPWPGLRWDEDRRDLGGSMVAGGAARNVEFPLTGCTRLS